MRLGREVPWGILPCTLGSNSDGGCVSRAGWLARTNHVPASWSVFGVVMFVLFPVKATCGNWRQSNARPELACQTAEQ